MVSYNRGVSAALKRHSFHVSLIISARRYLHRVYVNDSLDEAEKAEGLSTEEEARRQHSYLERKNAHLAKKKLVAERERAVEAVKGRVQNTVLLRDLADLHRQTTIDKQVRACLVCLRNASLSDADTFSTAPCSITAPCKCFNTGCQ